MSYKLLDVPNVAKNYPVCASSCMIHEIKLMSQQSTQTLQRIINESPQPYHSKMAYDTLKIINFSQRRCENIAILDNKDNNIFSGTLVCEVSKFFTDIYKTIVNFLPDRFKDNFKLQNRLDEPVYANLEAAKIETIIYNLVSNSFYHGKADRIYLGFSVTDNKLSFWVRDNGTGILTALPETKHLADNLSSNLVTCIPLGFKGIGLSVCRHFADLMQGSIKYCNQKSGVKFIVTLPLNTSPSGSMHQDSDYEPNIYYLRLAFGELFTQD